MYKYFILGYVLLLLHIAPGLFAQSKNCSLDLKGTIRDGETRELLPGVLVTLWPGGNSFVSDARGGFQFTGLCHGSYHVSFQLLGYKKLTAHYHLENTVLEEVFLHSDTCQLESITVVGEREPEMVTMPVKYLEGKTLDALQGQNLGDMVKSLPGVSVIQTGGNISKPVIHGLTGQRILLLQAGMRQEGQQWGSEHAPEIDPYMAQILSVMKGAAGVRYGSDALGGVLVVEPAPLPVYPGIKGHVHLFGNSNGRQGAVSAMVQGQSSYVPGLSFRSHFTLKSGGNLQAPSYYLANTGLQERNYSFQLGYQKEKWGTDVYYSQFYTKLGILLSSTFGNLSDLQKALTSGQPRDTASFTYDIRRPYQEVTHHLVRSKTYYHFSSRTQLEFLLGFQSNERKEYDRHFSRKAEQEDWPQYGFQLYSYNVQPMLTHRFDSQWKLQVGAEALAQNNAIFGTRYFIPAFQTWGGGGFVLIQKKGQTIEWEAGLRYDRRQISATPWVSSLAGRIPVPVEKGYQNVSATLGLNKKWNNGHHLQAHVGTGWRPPTVAEMYTDGIRHGGAGIERGLAIDKDATKDSLQRYLPPEVAQKAVVSYSTIQKAFDIQLDVHGSYIQNFIYARPDIAPGQSALDAVELTVRGAYPVYRYTQANVVLYGADLSAEVKIVPSVAWLLKGSLIRGWNLSQQEHLIYMPTDQLDNSLRWKPRNLSFLQENYLLLGNQAVRQQTLYPENQDFTPPPNGYSLWYAEAGTTLFLGKQPIQVSFAVHNIMNVSYRPYLDRFRYFADSPGRSFQLRVKIPFQWNLEKKPPKAETIK